MTDLNMRNVLPLQVNGYVYVLTNNRYKRKNKYKIGVCIDLYLTLLRLNRDRIRDKFYVIFCKPVYCKDLLIEIIYKELDHFRVKKEIDTYDNIDSKKLIKYLILCIKAFTYMLYKKNHILI